jgi:general secretion pathway protein A
MYERFYGFKERPFELLPDPKFLFLTARQREALSNLEYGLTAARGLTLLIGEAGTGKTTLLQAALNELRESPVRHLLLSNPTLTRAEFYEFLAKGFNLSPEAATSKTQFLFELRSELVERQEASVRSALIFDEAQSIPYELLEEIRLLSNIETPTTKLLNVVLAGQPELADRLNESSLRQLKQRISLRCELQPMDLSEAASYMAGRIRIAGGRPEVVFTREAVAAVFAASGGLPRLINVVCDNALIGGFAQQLRPISAACVEEVCRDFDMKCSAAVAPALSDFEVPAEEPVDRHLVGLPGSSPSVPQVADSIRDAEDEQAPEVKTPMFGTYQRKRSFSFF